MWPCHRQCVITEGMGRPESYTETVEKSGLQTTPTTRVYAYTNTGVLINERRPAVPPEEHLSADDDDDDCVEGSDLSICDKESPCQPLANLGRHPGSDQSPLISLWHVADGCHDNHTRLVPGPPCDWRRPEQTTGEMRFANSLKWLTATINVIYRLVCGSKAPMSNTF